MMNFTALKIPEGEVTKIRDSNGKLLWRKNTFQYKINAKTTREIIGNMDETGYINKTGAIITNSAWKASDFLPCEPGAAVVVSGGTAPAICFFDKNKNFISGISYMNENPKDIVIPPTAYFFRWSVANNAVFGSHVNIPFSNATELFHLSLMDNRVINIQGEVVTDYITGSYNYTGECNAIAIPCKDASAVNFSGFGATATRLLTCFYDANDAPIVSSRQKPNVQAGSLTVPEGAEGVRFSYYYSVGSTQIAAAFRNFTVEVVW